MRFTLVTICSMLLSFGAQTLEAQDKLLVVQVVDTQGAPVAGVVLSTKADGQVANPTDIAGKTHIRLTSQFHPGSWVSLALVKVLDGRNLVFVSPWDGRARVPAPDEADNFVEVVLTRFEERLRLQSRNTLRDSLVTSLSERKRPRRKLNDSSH